MGKLLDLDFVSHVSLVDEPAVQDAKYLVAKRASAGGSSDTDSSQNLETILKSMSGDSDSFDVEKFTDNLSTAVKEAAAEGIQEGMQEADLSGEQDAGSDGEDGSSDGDVDSDIMDRIDQLEERLTGEDDSGSGDGDAGSQGDAGADGDGDAGADGDGDGDVPDDSLEKRLEAIEKSLEQGDGDRRGAASILDDQDVEETSVAKGDGSWSFQDSIKKSKEQAANQQTQEDN